MKSEKTSFLIVDDYEQVRRALKELIEQNPHYEVIGEAGDGETALKLITELAPDILFVDINMNPLDGFVVARAVAISAPEVKIIGFSVNNDPLYAKRMLALGAKGYLTKSISFEELNFALEEIIKGHIYICEEIRKKME